MHLHRLQWALEKCKISPTVVEHEFVNYKSLPKEHGVYSIWQKDICIYVGQAGGNTGFIGRFEHHYNKAHGILKPGTSHGKGWQYNRLQENWTPDTWRVEYFYVDSAVHRTFLEGAMMLEFDPLCNDENFYDRQKKTG